MKVVIAVDVQKDFIPGGKLAYSYPNRNVELHISEYVHNMLEKNNIVFATMDTHLNSYLYTYEGSKLPIKHCILDTDGRNLYDVLDDLMKDHPEWIIDKNTFGSTELIGRLRSIDAMNSIDEIELCGFCTSICVISNALLLRTAFPNKKITILKDLCGDIDKNSHEAALKVAKNCLIEVRNCTEK